MKWFNDQKGKVSALRIIVVPAGVLGMLLVIAGAIAMFLKLPDAGTAIVSGAGMVATAQGAKAWQAQAEK